MENNALKELLNEKFDHINTKIEDQKEYLGGRIDEGISLQKIANGNVAALQEESEKCKKHRAIADSKTPWWKKLPMFIVIPVAFTIMGIGINDHYNLKNLETNSQESQAKILLHIEKKSMAYEYMSKCKLESIMTLDSAQAKIDSFLMEKYRVRSITGNSLPEF